MHNNKALWGVLHFLAIISVFVSLLTGLRIAVLDHDYLLIFSHFLPQGELHSLHIFSACVFTLCALFYAYWRLLGQVYSLSKLKTRNFSIRYHLIVTYVLYVVTFLSCISGWLLFAENISFDKSLILFIHYASAIGFILYLALHAGAWLIELGLRIFNRLLSPLKQIKRSAALVIVVIITVPLFWIVMKATSSHVLVVNTINVDQYIQIDGIADESFWEQALPQTIFTHGGANFEDGATPITIKALQNGNELFMHVEWQDATESLRHLPLVKTDSGWRVQQNGFHHFAETKYYEDKLAIILSENCEFGAAGTAHLGPRPLKDKPKHWTGLGYHYSETDVVDLWHWKAVRTNHMRLMDDNYIGKPDIVREGARRYKAGYKTDARESGAYKMNWKWYSPNGVVPKRLPFNNEWLAPYQSDGNIQEAEIPWVLPWFDGEAYSSLKDNLPIGTVLPSILYTSNQFEGDRAHVRAYAQWQDGKWSLELFRKLNTGSDKDVALRDGLCLWVAAFDHAQIAHTRHVRPIKLRFKP